MRAQLEQADPKTRARVERRLHQWRTRVQRFLADLDYQIHQPLGIREGTLITWAGMRGVVTLAAAQTLPRFVPHRSLLIVVAFLVAAGSLVIQGGTLPWMVRALGLAGQDSAPEGEWDRLAAHLNQATADPALWEGLPPEQVPLAKVQAKRQALLDLRSTGIFSSRSLATAMTSLDAEEISLEVRLSGSEN
jgi:CPA1 family monovalent cation:H+ antiporter